MPSRLRERWGLWLGVVLGLVGYGALVALDASAGTLRDEFTSWTILWYLVAFAGFLVAIWWNERRPIPMLWLWVAPIAFRLLMLVTTPTLSDDVYRYLWDGHLVTEGVSPYAYAIEAPELDHLEIPARSLANNPSLASPYLPAAQLVFGTLAFALPSQPLTMQIAMVLFDLGAALLLMRLLVVVALPSRRVMLYLWNPLVIVEIAHSAHLDALMILLTMAGLYWTFAPRSDRLRWAAPLAMAAATLTRLLPIVVVPVLWWRWRWRQRALYAGVTVGAILPFGLTAGWGLTGEATGTGLFGAARVYGSRFSFNSGPYLWLERQLDGVGVIDAGIAARGLVVAVMLGVIAGVWLRSRRTDSPNAALRLIAVPIAAYVLLTPILHPWYLLLLVAVLPFLTPRPSEGKRRWVLVAPWIYLSGALVLSYLTYLDPLRFAEIEWVRTVEWYPTIALLLLATVWATRDPTPDAGD